MRTGIQREQSGGKQGRGKQGRVTWMNVLLTLFLAPLILWLIGLIMFTARLPDKVADPAIDTDAIVVLTGGSRRLSTGIDLLAQEKGRMLFLSGVGAKVTLADLETTDEVQNALAQELRDRIVLGHEALNTFGNARETAIWMRSCGYESLRLVTAGYHMPRSLAEFRAVMPSVIIVPHPVFPADIKQAEWWKWSGTSRLMLSEYSKFLVAWVRARLGLFPSLPDKASAGAFCR